MNSACENTQVKEIPIGQHYSLPMVSFRNALSPLVRSGAIISGTILADTVHPNDLGHEIAARLITNLLDEIYENRSIIAEPDYNIPELKFSPEKYADGKVLTNADITPGETTGWTDNFIIDYAPAWSERYDGGWKATEIGQKIVFKVTGRNIGVVYKRSFETNMGRVKVTVDGGEPVYINSFVPTAGVAPLPVEIASGLEDTEHTVEIELAEPTDSRTTGTVFGLCALLISR